jgi:hypothetical protein
MQEGVRRFPFYPLDGGMRCKGTGFLKPPPGGVFVESLYR